MEFHLDSIFTFVDSTDRYTEKKNLVLFNILFCNFSLWIRAVCPVFTVCPFKQEIEIITYLCYKENILSKWDAFLLKKQMY